MSLFFFISLLICSSVFLCLLQILADFKAIPSDQHLFFDERELKDDQTLHQARILPKGTIFLEVSCFFAIFAITSLNYEYEAIDIESMHPIS